MELIPPSRVHQLRSAFMAARIFALSTAGMIPLLLGAERSTVDSDLLLASRESWAPESFSLDQGVR